MNNDSEKFAKKVGKNLRLLREDHELTQEEIAKLCKVGGGDKNQWSKYERGINLPGHQVIESIIKHFGIDYNAIYGDYNKVLEFRTVRRNHFSMEYEKLSYTGVKQMVIERGLKELKKDIRLEEEFSVLVEEKILSEEDKKRKLEDWRFLSEIYFPAMNYKKYEGYPQQIRVVMGYLRIVGIEDDLDISDEQYEALENYLLFLLTRYHKNIKININEVNVELEELAETESEE